MRFPDATSGFKPHVLYRMCYIGKRHEDFGGVLESFRLYLSVGQNVSLPFRSDFSLDLIALDLIAAYSFFSIPIERTCCRSRRNRGPAAGMISGAQGAICRLGCAGQFANRREIGDGQSVEIG